MELKQGIVTEFNATPKDRHYLHKYLVIGEHSLSNLVVSDTLNGYIKDSHENKKTDHPLHYASG